MGNQFVISTGNDVAVVDIHVDTAVGSAYLECRHQNGYECLQVLPVKLVATEAMASALAARALDRYVLHWAMTA